MKSRNNNSKTVNVDYLSSAATVAMADEWYDYSDLDHFWVQWRLQALMRHAKYLPPTGANVFEVGCGHGVFRDQLESQLNYVVDACDLNEEGIKRAKKGAGRLFVYNILEKHVNLCQKYPAVFLMDVIEHIEEEEEFLDASMYYVKPKGLVILNVPALNVLFSCYDSAAGHVRRYNKKMIHCLFSNVGLDLVAVSYWGFPMLPLLLLRKYYLKFVSDEKIIETGFAPPSPVIHSIFHLCRMAESLSPLAPWLGTSLIAVGRLKD